MADDSDGELAYGGVCPVCGEEFVDGFDELEAGESRDARICIVVKGDSRGECLLHLPEEDSLTDDDTHRYQVGIVLPLDGLASLNNADEILAELQHTVEDSQLSRDRQRLNSWQSALSKLDRIQRQVERGGAGYELHISVELRAQEQEDSDD